jgi:hypothetical protein
METEFNMNLAQAILPNVSWDTAISTLPPGPPGPMITQVWQTGGQEEGKETPKAKEKMDDSLEEKLKRQGVSQDTINRLATNGFLTENLLRTMEVEDVAVINIKPLAQQRLIRSILAEQKQRNATREPAQAVSSRPTTEPTARAGQQT